MEWQLRFSFASEQFRRLREVSAQHRGKLQKYRQSTFRIRDCNSQGSAIQQTSVICRESEARTTRSEDKMANADQTVWRSVRTRDMHTMVPVCYGDSGCWPRFLIGPNEGNLDSRELSDLLSVLRHFTGTQDCFFRFSEIPFLTTNKPILFRGVLDELPAFLTKGDYQFTPEYWWPVDRSWCVCSDYDLTFTVVAGSKELVSRLLKHDSLEVLAVSSQTRIDSYAPIPK